MISMVDPTPSRFSEPMKPRGGARMACLTTDKLPGVDLARGMGWFSVGMGLAQLLTPGLVGSLTGVRNNRLLRLYGMRQLACGVGILNSEQPANWMWARVAGDVMDFATVLEGLASGDENRTDEAFTALLGVAAATITDAACASSLQAAEAVES
jgi:hypothetical protein